MIYYLLLTVINCTSGTFSDCTRRLNNTYAARKTSAFCDDKDGTLRQASFEHSAVLAGLPSLEYSIVWTESDRIKW